MSTYYPDSQDGDSYRVDFQTLELQAYHAEDNRLDQKARTEAKQYADRQIKQLQDWEF
jgi:hypothetical protein